MDKLRILISSDYRLTLTGIRRLINAAPDLVVVGEAEGLQRTLDSYHQGSVDAVVLDSSVPGPSTLRLIGKLMRALPQARVVVLSTNENVAFVRSMLALGILGYVLKSAAEHEFFQALRAVARGRRFIDPRLSESGDALALAPELLPAAGKPALSERERQVLSGIARGFTRQEIAQSLQVSVKTVETYRARVRKKLELQSRAELVQYALASGLLEDEEMQAGKPDA
jgi:two-component system, NarL family, response regulator NreC